MTRALKNDALSLMLRVALTQPDAPALRTRAGDLDYAHFVRKVRQYAFALKSCLGEGKVAIRLPQGEDAYAVMFATWMAGGYYAPINVEAPLEKQDLVEGCFCADVCVTTRSHLRDQENTSVLLIEDMLGEELEEAAPPAELAYVIFTSGSTGISKGVMISKASLACYLEWAIPALALGPGAFCSQHPNIGFDLSVIDIFATLCSGACLVPFIGAKDRLLPGYAVADLGINVWVSVPSVIDLMLQAGSMTPEKMAAVKCWFFCGEPLNPHHLEAIFAVTPEAEVINAYGPTEATVSCTELRLNKDNYKSACEASVAIGEPIPSMGYQLLGGENPDEGEIVITGPQLAKGYWQDDVKTEAAFHGIPGTGARGYFTGDWAVRKKGHVFFQRRMDRQVKIHGYRLELGEVDAAVRKLLNCQAYSFIRENHITTFVETNQPIDFARLRTDLAKGLANYAIPQKVIEVEQFPRNANDKIDVLTLKELLEYE